jgi:hypothetical protein
MATPTDTQAVDATESVTPELSAEEKAQMFEALPGEFKEAIVKVNGEIADHNKKIDSIKAAEAKDPKLIKAEIFEQNPSNNKKIARLLTEYKKLEDQMENLRSQGYGIIETDGLMPKDLSEEELAAIRTDVTESTKSIRNQADALLTFETMMPMLKDKLTIHLAEVKTRRGVAKQNTGPKGEGTKRIRFKQILVNGVTQDDKNNTVWQNVKGEEKYTFTFTTQYLKKQSSDISWTAKDLTDGYLKGLDENNLPDEHEFVMPHTYKDQNGNEQTVNYTIKAVR